MFNIIVSQFKLLSNGHFWYPLTVRQPFGCQATASQSPKTMFLQKHKMAARGLVWPLNFSVKKQKVAHFCEPLEVCKNLNLLDHSSMAQKLGGG